MNKKSNFSGALLAFTLLLTVLWVNQARAQTDISKSFGDFTVYYTVFNSTFLTPEIASLYGFTRGDNRALVNISLVQSTDQGDTLGLPAEITGIARNLIGQTTNLGFVEISEGEATYYMASFVFADQDPLNFDIQVKHQGTRVAHRVQFTRTLYED